MPTHRLWTPIANALEAYRRRVVIDPKAEYEHIWRLIHIQEALAVSLASLMAARLAHVVDPSDANSLRTLREALTGLRPDADGSDDDDDVEPSPWGGSIGAWIELLRRFGKSAIRPEDPFLAALATYLSSTPNRSLAFVDAWARIAPVPATFRDPALDRVGRLGAINSFRNKLAHVPVPQRLLADLHRGMRVEVLDGLTEKFNPETDANSPAFLATSYREPLTGILFCGKTFLTGANEVGIDAMRNSDLAVVEAGFGKGSTTVEWPVEPFFRIDGEAKAALLFRVSDLQREPGATGYDGEYHRFAAELEPVTYATIPTDTLAPWIPRAHDDPPPSSQPTLPASPDLIAASAASKQHTRNAEGRDVEEPATDSVRSPRELRRLGEEAFVRRDYPSAVVYFDALAEVGDAAQYNDVAQSKHGAALWRAAERARAHEPAGPLIERAIELLKGAERHRDPRYAARSAYECSKALWHLWRSTTEREHLLAALAAAERAVARSPHEAFISWQARVKADADREFPQGLPGPSAPGA